MNALTLKDWARVAAVSRRLGGNNMMSPLLVVLVPGPPWHHYEPTSTALEYLLRLLAIDKRAFRNLLTTHARIDEIVATPRCYAVS